MRFSENLQRFALCCTLCCTDVALRCTETPQFLLHRCPLQGLVPPDHCARNPVQRKAPGGAQPLGEGLYAAPFLGMETRHGFGAAGWVLSGSEQLSSFIMIKHTHGGSESSNRSVSSVICTAFNLGQVPLGPCSVTAARDGHFERSEHILARFEAPFFGPQIWSQFLAPLHVDEKDFCLSAVAGAILGDRFRRPICFNFFSSGTRCLVPSTLLHHTVLS